jgi:hypothetical protein
MRSSLNLLRPLLQKRRFFLVGEGGKDDRNQNTFAPLSRRKRQT